MKTQTNHDGDRAEFHDEPVVRLGQGDYEREYHGSTALDAAIGIGRFLVGMSIILAGGAVMFADQMVGVVVMVFGVYMIAARTAK